MAKVLQRGCAWLLIVAVPFHALTALYLDGRGPAHFHPDAGALEHEQFHDHDGIGRHHHPADSNFVLSNAAPALDPALEEAIGRSATMIAALVSDDAGFLLPLLDRHRYSSPRPLPQILFATRLERPPRADRA